MTWLVPTIAWTLALIALAVFVWALFWDRARGRKRCPKCWYDMSGASPDDAGTFMCPECGNVAGTERQLGKTRRYWWVAAAGAFVAASTYIGPRLLPVYERGWIALAPTWALERTLTDQELWIWFHGNCRIEQGNSPDTPLYDGIERVRSVTFVPGAADKELAYRARAGSSTRWSGSLVHRIAGAHERMNIGGVFAIYRLAHLPADDSTKRWLLTHALDIAIAQDQDWARFTIVNRPARLLVHSSELTHERIRWFLDTACASTPVVAEAPTSGYWMGAFTLTGDELEQTVSSLKTWNRFAFATPETDFEYPEGPVGRYVSPVFVFGDRLVVVGSRSEIDAVADLVGP